VCAQTPARAAVDARGIGAFSTWAAQFRDEFRNVAARYERASAHASVSAAMPDLQLPESDESARA
jgi:hypothetical protein